MSLSRALRSALPTATRWIHHFLEHRELEGKIAIDATTGNGHDTLFLARRVGTKGKVYGFDLQASAIENTRARLLEHGIAAENFELHARSHAELNEALPSTLQGKVSAILFNLGYLPGGDKSVITLTGSTLLAIQAALDYLEENGVLTIAAYPGHEGGREEKDEVERLLAQLDPTDFEVQKLAYLNFRPTTPVSYLIRRRSALAPNKLKVEAV